MPSQESTAIKDLIHLVQGRRLEPESENPFPEVYVTAAGRAQAAPARIASGTKPPPIAQPRHAPPQPAPQVEAKPKYMLPIVEQDDEQTALWNDKAEVETAPAVPAIAPHLATVIATPANVRAVPAILSGPIAPESPAPKPAPSRPRKIVYGAMPSESSAMPSTVVSSSASNAMPSHASRTRPPIESSSGSSAATPGSRAIPSTEGPSSASASASRAMYSRAMPASAPSRGMPALAHPIGLGPQFPAVAMNIALPPAPRLPPSAYLIARELVSSATRWGGLAFLALIALGIGIYVALDGRDNPKPTGPTERDRAIAIMNGETPPPEPTVVHAPPAGETRVEVKAEATAQPGTTAWRPEPSPAMTAEPITEPTAEPITEPTAPGEPTAEPSNESPPVEERADDTGAETIALDDIEMEPTSARPSRAKLQSRSARARKAKLIASTEASPTRRTSKDPVLAILAEKPSKRRGDPVLAILAEKPAKKLEKPKKPVKEVAVGPATTIAAPKGAPAAKGTGKVTITSNVAALIFLDGRATGKTTPSALVVPAGDHQITLLEPRSKKAKTATVQIAANKTASVRRDFN